MAKKLITSKLLQKSYFKKLGITGYDHYRYSRNNRGGLPQVASNLSLYDLEVVREWLGGFGDRENRRLQIKENLLNHLTADEERICS